MVGHFAIKCRCVFFLEKAMGFVSISRRFFLTVLLLLLLSIIVNLVLAVVCWVNERAAVRLVCAQGHLTYAKQNPVWSEFTAKSLLISTYRSREALRHSFSPSLRREARRILIRSLEMQIRLLSEHDANDEAVERYNQERLIDLKEELVKLKSG